MNKKENEMLQAQFERLCERGKLFRSTVTGEQLWTAYMDGFGRDHIFLSPTSSVHNCRTCRRFIERYGNIVALDDEMRIITMWQGEGVSDEYRESFRRMDDLLRGADISGVFVETFDFLNGAPYEKTNRRAEDFALGTASNVRQYTEQEVAQSDTVEAGRVYTFHHLMVRLPRQFVSFGTESVEAIQARRREDKQQLERGLKEIDVATLELVADLIRQGSLLNGDSYLEKVESFTEVAYRYTNMVPHDIPGVADRWLWSMAYDYKYCRFRSELIGTLCTELAQGKDLEKACEDWNRRVDPANYMKAKAPVTQRMIDQAREFVTAGGYEQSFNRRCATMEDIRVSDILHSNVGDGRVKPVSVFDQLKPTATRHKATDFKDVPVVPVAEFMADVLPHCKRLEAYLENRQERNFVTLTAPQSEQSKPIFRWPNNFGWTYNGDLAGRSEIREAVKQAGGFVDAYFRFSILWNENGRDICDLDAHAFEPDGTEIFYANHNISKGNGKTRTGGCLDIDMIRPESVGVENIYWIDPQKLADGTYEFAIFNYDDGPNTGAKAEIAIGDQVFQYEIPHRITRDKPICIARITLKDGRMASAEHCPCLKDGSGIVRELYGLQTCQFHAVSLVCLSPNYWQSEVGHKHYFFMLAGARAPKPFRGFHNEFLRPELLDHRKVMEVLGQTMRVESTDGQLSGLGFNATVRDDLVLRIDDGQQRVIRVQF